MNSACRTAGTSAVRLHLSSLLLATTAMVLVSVSATLAQQVPIPGNDPATTDAIAPDPALANQAEDQASAIDDGTPDRLVQDQQDDIEAARLRGETRNLRDNLRESSVDGLGLRLPADRDQAPGIDLGGFTFRPSLSEQAGMERTRDSGGTVNRTFLQSTLKGSLTSDWSSHEMIVNGEVGKQSTFSGPSSDDPSYRLDATLKLDLMDDTAASLKAGFSRARETATDTNALQGASLQSTVTTLGTGTELLHDFGRIRTTLSADLVRSTYGAAIDSTGKIVSQADRDNNTASLRARLGYELSPALIPFIETSYSSMMHDQGRDRFGYERDLSTLGASSGVQIDLGEKLKGELSVGYSLTRFADARLADLAALTVNGNAVWSPHRGTDVAVGLATTVEPSTIAGVNGAVSYTASGEIRQTILKNVTARASLASTWRNYKSPAVSDETVIVTGAGLTWGLSRYLDLTGDLQWQATRPDKGTQSSIMRGLVGLTLRR